MDLTKEQIEAHKQTAERYAASKALGSLIDSNHLIALCTLALRGLEGQWRPLSEIEGSGAIVTAIDPHDDSTGYHIVFKYPSGKWLGHSMGRPWPPETRAFPLSALPAPPEGK